MPSKCRVSSYIYEEGELIDQSNFVLPEEAALFMANAAGDEAIFRDEDENNLVHVKRGKVISMNSVYWASLTESDKLFIYKSAEQMENSFASGL